MARDNWHLEKKVPITLLIIMLGNIFCGVWFASGLCSDTTNMKKQIEGIQQTLDTRGKIGEQYFTRLDRLEVRFDGFEKMQSDMSDNIKIIMNRQYNDNRRLK